MGDILIRLALVGLLGLTGVGAPLGENPVTVRFQPNPLPAPLEPGKTARDEGST